MYYWMKKHGDDGRQKPSYRRKGVSGAKKTKKSRSESGNETQLRPGKILETKG